MGLQNCEGGVGRGEGGTDGRGMARRWGEVEGGRGGKQVKGGRGGRAGLSHGERHQS